MIPRKDYLRHIQTIGKLNKFKPKTRTKKKRVDSPGNRRETGLILLGSSKLSFLAKKTRFLISNG